MSDWSMFSEFLAHAAAMLSLLFVAYLVAFAMLRVRERRREPGLCRSCPLCRAWIATLLMTALLLVPLFIHVRWLWDLHQADLWIVGARESAQESAGLTMRMCGGLFLLLTAMAWLGWGRQALRREAPPGRHAFLALWGLAITTAGLVWLFLEYRRGF